MESFIISRELIGLRFELVFEEVDLKLEILLFTNTLLGINFHAFFELDLNELLLVPLLNQLEIELNFHLQESFTVNSFHIGFITLPHTGHVRMLLFQGVNLVHMFLTLLLESVYFVKIFSF